MIILSGGQIAHNGVIYKSVEHMNTVMIAVRTGLSAVGTEIELAVCGTNGTAFNFKQIRIGRIFDPNRHAGIRLQITALYAVDIEADDGTDVAGAGLIVGGHRNKQLVVLVTKALHHIVGQIPDRTAKVDSGEVQFSQILHCNITAGGAVGDLSRKYIVAALEHQCNFSGAGGNHLDAGNELFGAIVLHVIVADLCQGSTIERETHQTVIALTCTAGTNKHSLDTVNCADTQVIGMSKLAEIIGAGGTVLQIDNFTGCLVYPGDGTGLLSLAVNLCAIDVCSVYIHALHRITTTLGSHLGNGCIFVIQSCVCLSHRSDYRKQSQYNSQAKAQSHQSFELHFHSDPLSVF